MSDTIEVIRQSILTRKPIEATYKGLRRKLCPHVLGTRDGERRILAYQVEGDSSTGLGGSGSPDNWRYMIIDRLKDVSLVEGDWCTGPNYSFYDALLGDIDMAVEDNVSVS